MISDEYRVTFCDFEGDVFSSSSGERNSCLVSSNPILSLNCLPADTDICQWGFWTKILKEYFPSETILDNILILLWCFHFVRERVSYLVGNKLIYPQHCLLSCKRSVVQFSGMTFWQEWGQRREKWHVFGKTAWGLGATKMNLGRVQGRSEDSTNLAVQIIVRRGDE